MPSKGKKMVVQCSGYKSGEEETSNDCMGATHTTIVGLDCGEFVILGTDGRLTTKDGEVVNDNFIKHGKINEKVHLVFAGVVATAYKYIGKLRTKLKEIQGGNDFDVDQVALVAGPLLKIISDEEHNLEKERDQDKVHSKDAPRALHIILAGYSPASPFGVRLYTIDDSFKAEVQVIATGGSGGTDAHNHIISSGCTKETLANMNEKYASNFVMETIHYAIKNDWRSGGKMRESVTREATRRKGKSATREATVKIGTYVYYQPDPASCKNQYSLDPNEIFRVDYLPANPPAGGGQKPDI